MSEVVCDEKKEDKVEDGKLFSKKGTGAAFRRRTKQKTDDNEEAINGERITYGHIRIQKVLSHMTECGSMLTHKGPRRPGPYREQR
jgi:hypothetical protein